MEFLLMLMLGLLFGTNLIIKIFSFQGIVLEGVPLFVSPIISMYVVNFSRSVPHGLLVFFPSYPVMNACVETWRVS